MAAVKNKTTSKKAVETVKSSDLKLPTPIYENINIDFIHANFNIRFSIEDSDFSSLYESIKVNGIIEPLIVNKVTDLSDYDLVAGERRLRCACELHMNAVPCVVYSDLTNSQFFEIMLSENLIREDLNPLEEAIGMKKIIDAGMTQSELAERIGKTQQFVSYRLQLLEMPEILQRQITTRVVTPRHARELSKFSNAPLANDFYQFYEDYQRKKQSDDENGPDYTIPIKGIEDTIDEFFDEYDNKNEDKNFRYHFFSVDRILSNENSPQYARCSKCDHRYGDNCFDIDCVVKTRDEYDSWNNEQHKKNTAKDSEIPVVEFNTNDYYKRERPLTPGDCGSCPNLEERKRSYNESRYFVCTNPDCFKEKEKMLVERLLSEEKEVRGNINDILVNSRKNDVIPDLVSFLFEKHLGEISTAYKEAYGVKMDVKKEFSHIQKIAFLQLLFLSSKVPSVGFSRYLNREDFIRFSEDVRSLGYDQGD